MTSAFELFKKQYEMTGSEKADGYSRDAFIGLDADEKEVVFDLLATELPFSADWLFFIDAEKAISYAKKKEKELRGSPYKHVYMLQENLVRYSGELVYQEHMIEDYANYANRLKPLVIESISRTPTNETVISFFKQIVLVEADADSVASAADNLLYLLKFPRSTVEEKQKYDRLFSELRSDNNEAKKRALAEIRKQEISFFAAR
nr:hypothetical protein [uncultured Duganella sp.]